MRRQLLPSVFRMILVAAIAIGGARGADPPSQPVVVPLHETEGHPSIDLRLDGKGPFRLLLDTGSGAGLIVDRELAAELGLRSTGTRRIGDPNSPEAIEAQSVTVPRVELGGLTLKNVEAISWKREARLAADGPRGVVGLGLFGSRLVTLDRGTLVVEAGALPPADGTSVLAASFQEGIPSLTISVAGVAFRAHLDSGSTGFIGLPLAAAEKLPLEAPPVRVGRARTASGDYSVSEARLRGSVRLGGIVIDRPKLRFVDLPVANIGFDLLRSLVVTIDRKHARVRLASTGAPIEPSDRPRLGIMIEGSKDGRLPIESVAPGSPAEAAGLRAGDQIARLNGRTVAELSRYEISVALQTRPLAITVLRDGETIDLTIGEAPARTP